MSSARGTPKPPLPGLEKTKVPSLPLAGGVFYRCARKDRPLVDWDNRPTSRFSHPGLPFPVLYLAPSKHTAFWECFGDELNDQVPEDRGLSEHSLEVRQWVKFIIPPLAAFDASDPPALRAVGADGGTFLAPYSITQQWAKFLMEDPPTFDGLQYRSRLDSNQKCLAVFGRPKFQAMNAIVATVVGDLLNDADFLRWLEAEEIDLIPG